MLLGQIQALRRGQVSAALMAELAGIWSGRHADARGKTPAERFKHYCTDHRRIVLAVRAGLKAFVQRDDLPDAQELIGLSAAGLTHIARDACLLGADLLWSNQPATLEAMSPKASARLMVFYLSQGYPGAPDWFKHLAGCRAELMAAVFTDYARARVISGDADSAGLHLLYADPKFETVARLAVPKLLSAFPARIRSAQLHPLRLLLLTALRYQMPELSTIVADKIQRKSVETAQKGLWLFAGTQQNPAQFQDTLWAHTEGSWQRKQQIAAFFGEWLDSDPTHRPQEIPKDRARIHGTLAASGHSSRFRQTTSGG